MGISVMFTFEYALKAPNGLYYTGKAGDGCLGDKYQAFTYTETGAYRKIDTNPAFKGFTVERIL